MHELFACKVKTQDRLGTAAGPEMLQRVDGARAGITVAVFLLPARCVDLGGLHFIRAQQDTGSTEPASLMFAE